MPISCEENPLRWTPFALTTLRLILGPLAVVIAQRGWSHIYFAPLLIVATLSDIYDGVLARRLGVATPALRRYDSVTDVIFYLCVLYAGWIMRKAAIEAHWLPITLLVISELVTIVVSLIKFGLMPATHTYLAKCYGLCLLACCTAMLAFDASAASITLLAIIAVAANLEITAILVMSTTAPVDIKSVFTMRQQRRATSRLNSCDA